MRCDVLRERLRVDANRRLLIEIPTDFGDQVDVIILPLLSAIEHEALDEDNSTNLAAKVAITLDDAEEDAIWEGYIHV